MTFCIVVRYRKQILCWNFKPNAQIALTNLTKLQLEPQPALDFVPPVDQTINKLN